MVETKIQILKNKREKLFSSFLRTHVRAHAWFQNSLRTHVRAHVCFQIWILSWRFGITFWIWICNKPWSLLKSFAYKRRPPQHVKGVENFLSWCFYLRTFCIKPCFNLFHFQVLIFFMLRRILKVDKNNTFHC